MKISEIRELTGEELTARIDETRKNIVELRFQHALRKLESPAKLRLERKKLAQLLTIVTEKQSADKKGAAAPKATEAKAAKVAKAEPKKAAAKAPAAKKPAAEKAAADKPAAKEKAKAEAEAE
jgi:ribosomal protein L29